MASTNKTTRQDANRVIIRKLETAVEAFPDWRFHQILQNCGIEIANADQFFEESVETLSNMNSNPTMRTAHEMFVLDERAKYQGDDE